MCVCIVFELIIVRIIIMVFKLSTYKQNIKTHGHVWAAKKAMWCTSVLFTGTANSPFATPHISITIGPISIKLKYFIPSVYATLHTKCEGNQPNSLRDMCSLKIDPFSSQFSSSLHCLTKITLRQPKTPFLWINFFQI